MAILNSNQRPTSVRRSSKASGLFWKVEFERSESNIFGRRGETPGESKNNGGESSQGLLSLPILLLFFLSTVAANCQKV